MISADKRPIFTSTKNILTIERSVLIIVSCESARCQPGRRLCTFSNRISSVNRQVSNSDDSLLSENESQF